MELWKDDVPFQLGDFFKVPMFIFRIVLLGFLGQFKFAVSFKWGGAWCFIGNGAMKVVMFLWDKEPNKLAEKKQN